MALTIGDKNAIIKQFLNKKKRMSQLNPVSFLKTHWQTTTVASLLAVGLVLATQSLAAGNTLIASMEAETFTSTTAVAESDTSASGGYTEAFVKNGEASNNLTNKVTATQLVVRARGSQCSGSPRMTITIDGKQVGKTSVTSNRYNDYTFPVTIPAGTHKLAVAFINDFSKRSCDRNLYVDKIDVFASSPASPSSSPSLTPSPTPTTTTSPVPVTGTTYYVSPRGSDSNTGTSPSAAWRTVARANKAAVNPGDGVLFEGGQVFTDAALMPSRSGSSGKPIVYGSYGTGQAQLPQGVWFVSVNWLTFQNLAINGSGQGIQASASGSGASYITINGNIITKVGIGINSSNFADHHWTITGNTIDQVADSGMILLGDQFTITKNTITNTGTDSSITYGKHGIYLKVTNATVTENTIRRWIGGSAVSVRYRNSVIERNNFSDGAIGISWFQYDSIPGTSYWRYNNISATAAADIYVSPSDTAGGTRESFVVTDNILAKTSGKYLDLQPTSGTYTVCCNTLR